MQQLANAGGRHHVTLRLSEQSGQVVTHPFAVQGMNFVAKDVPLNEALQIISEVAGYRPVYWRNEAILAPWAGGGYHEVSIVVRGHCRSRKSGTPIRHFTLVCTRSALRLAYDEQTTTTLHEVETDKYGAFSVSIPVAGYTDSMVVDHRRVTFVARPNRQRAVVLAVADKHYPARCSIDLNELVTEYTVNIEMDE